MMEKLLNDRISLRPFVYNRPSISSVSIRILILLSIQILFTALSKSYSNLFIIAAAFLGSLCASALSYLIKKEQPYNTIYVVLQGIIIGMLLPAGYPVPAVFFMTFISIFTFRAIICKSINSWINMSVFTVIIAWIIGSSFFPQFLITADLIPIKNPSVFLIQNGTFPIYSFDSAVTSFLNNSFFSYFRITIPEGLVSFLWDTHSTIPAFRFNLLTIISSLFLFSDNAFSSNVSGIFLFVYALLVRLFAPVFFGGQLNQGDVILALFTSGILFCATFMLQSYGTMPVSFIGKILFSIGSGIFAFLIIGCGTSPIGMAYTLLLSNILAMLIRIIEEKRNDIILSRVTANE